MTPEERRAGLHTEHYDTVVAFVLGQVRSRERAEEMAQETLLRAWLHLGRIEPGSATVRACLLTIARNLLAAERAEPGTRTPPG